MQKIVVKINKGVPEIEKISGGDMTPLEFIANMVSATILHLDELTDMLPEEIFFEMSRHATKIVDLINGQDQHENEVSKAMDDIINKHLGGEKNTENPLLN